MRILITGASGFIGTNALEYYKNLGCEVYGIDIKEPRNKDHIKYWTKVDICDFEYLQNVFENIQPEYVIHLAAKTDLSEKNDIKYYAVNVEGVENIVKLCGKASNIKRVLFASSMLVNTVGYKPKNSFDYNASTLYGHSKIIGEKIVYDNKDSLTEFCIIRPTSIWGEWFGEPYRNFFDIVTAGKFYHPGNKASTKTFGYVGNAVFQIDKLLRAEIEQIRSKVFYIGDTPPTNISHWADEIAQEIGINKPKKISILFFILLSWFGDIIGRFGMKFPMTSFRLKNMTTDHIVDLSNTFNVCGVPPFDRLTGTKNTLIWMRSQSH